MCGLHPWEVLPPRAVSVALQGVFGAAVRLWWGPCARLFPEFGAVAAVKFASAWGGAAHVARPGVPVCLEQGQAPGSCGAEQVRWRHRQAGHCRGFRRSVRVRCWWCPLMDGAGGHWPESLPCGGTVSRFLRADPHVLQHCPSGVTLGRSTSLPTKSIETLIFLFKHLIFHLRSS